MVDFIVGCLVDCGLEMSDLMILQRKKEVLLAGNHEYKERNSINSVQSSLKSHPVSLYEQYVCSQERLNGLNTLSTTFLGENTTTPDFNLCL